MCTRGRRTFFTDEWIVQVARTQILRTSERRSFEILAYTFMPDHLHLLVEGRDPSANLRGFAAALRRAISAACWHRASGTLWQDGYYERTLRSSEGTQRIIDYILNNPVRAGLVDNALDYPYSWSVSTRT